MNCQLAVVIPAYKDKFLDKALTSLKNQTDKNFNVYIGDDNSPNELRSICEQYMPFLNITYTKFPNNIGAKKLVEQWERCIALSKGEKWIWLFSDDDVADPNCVESFFSTIEKDNSRFDVYRFNTRIINDEDKITGESMESPFIDTSINMAYSILLGQRGNSMPDHIFSRHIYNKLGFVKTAYAQSADWGTSILFSSEKGICTVSGAKVNWRLGNYNISGMAANKKVQMFKGYLQFLIWFIAFYKSCDSEQKKGYTDNDIKEAIEINLKTLVRTHYMGVRFLSCFDLFRFYMALYGKVLFALKRTIGLYLIFHPRFNKTIVLFKSLKNALFFNHSTYI